MTPYSGILFGNIFWKDIPDLEYLFGIYSPEIYFGMACSSWKYILDLWPAFCKVFCIWPGHFRHILSENGSGQDGPVAAHILAILAAVGMAVLATARTAIPTAARSASIRAAGAASPGNI
jgi:hypothetical protein